MQGAETTIQSVWKILLQALSWNHTVQAEYTLGNVGFSCAASPIQRRYIVFGEIQTLFDVFQNKWRKNHPQVRDPLTCQTHLCAPSSLSSSSSSVTASPRACRSSKDAQQLWHVPPRAYTDTTQSVEEFHRVFLCFLNHDNKYMPLLYCLNIVIGHCQLSSDMNFPHCAILCGYG